MLSLKRVISLIASLSLAAFGMVACDDEESNNDQNKQITKNVTETETLTCTEVEGTKDFSKSGEEMMQYLIDHCLLSTYFRTEAFTGSSQKLGSPCFCYGDKCEMAKYERPEQGKIYGCDNVKAIPEFGMVPICLRSSEFKSIEPALYFPNGMCALAVSACETINDPGCAKYPNGNKTCEGVPTSEEDPVNGVDPYICGFGVFGSPEKITSGVNFNNDEAKTKIQQIECPEGNVLAQFMMDIKVKTGAEPSESMLDVVGCFQGCHSDADCRVGEYDFKLQAPGQIKCTKTRPNTEGVSAGVCFDIRTVEHSNIGITALKPGDFAWQD